MLTKLFLDFFFVWFVNIPMLCLMQSSLLHFAFLLFSFVFLSLWPYSHFREQTPLTDEQLVAG